MKRMMQMQNTFRTLHDWQVYLVIAIVGVIVYGKSVLFDFTYYDDTRLLVQNQAFIGNIANLPKLFTTDVFISIPNAQIFYRPLLNLLFMIEAQVAEDAPLLYHITNILLHLACTILVYILFKHMQLSKLMSLIAALFFCVHPIHTSAVVWIPGRNDTLLTLFILSSFLFFLRARETNRRSEYSFHALFLFFALLVKESAVVLPVLCISYVFLVKSSQPQRKELFFILASYVVVVSVWLVMRSMVHRTFEIHQSSGFLLDNIIGNITALFLYFGKFIWPFNFSVFPNTSDHSLIPGILGILLLAGILFTLRPTSLRIILWGFLWFFLFLLPSLVTGPVFYEHRAYCAFVGLLIAVVHLPLFKNLESPKIVQLVGVGLVLLVFSGLTFSYAEHFRNRLSYATNAYSTAPSAGKSYLCMASMYLDEGNDAAAEEVIVAGLKRNPQMESAHRMLGDIYANRKQYTPAAKEYETSLKQEPLDLNNYINYGKLYLEMGQIDETERLWKASVQINPDFLLGYYYLANFYVHSKNDPDSAMIYVEELQKRGEAVMPELLNAIESHPLYKKRQR